MRDPLPLIRIPLAGRDKDVPLDLGEVMSAVYDQAGYEYLIDYGEPAEPPLSPADARWAGQLLRKKGRR